MAHPTESSLHFCIDGEGFETLKMAYSVAVKRGFNGSYISFRRRVLAGHKTWHELTASVTDEGRIKGQALNSQKAEKRKSEREEMAALMAEMDARKKAVDARRD